MNDSNMTLLKNQLVEHEGLKCSAYTDSLGYVTIGVGRLIDARKGGGISHAEAMWLLENDIARIMSDLDRELPWWRSLDDVRQRVLIDMCFNLGINGLLTFKLTLAAVKEGRWEDAARGMTGSKWASQVKGRAVRLAEMMRTGR